MRFTFATLALLSAFAIPAAAHADTFDTFTLTSSLGTQTFQLPSNPTDINGGGAGFTIDDVTVINDGVTSTDELGFFGSENGGGMYYDFSYLGLFSEAPGPTLFSGLSSDPTFIPGTYTLSDTSFMSDDPTAVTVTISGAGVTPEPASLALLGTGLLGAVGMVRRRFKA